MIIRRKLYISGDLDFEHMVISAYFVVHHLVIVIVIFLVDILVLFKQIFDLLQKDDKHFEGL